MQAPWAQIDITFEQELTCDHFHPLSVRVLNCTERMGDFEICVHVFSEIAGQVVSAQPEMIVAGLLATVQQVAPQDRISHSVQLCFLAAGTYNLAVSCRDANSQRICWSHRVLAIDVLPVAAVTIVTPN
jgi:hypothetical protein